MDEDIDEVFDDYEATLPPPTTESALAPIPSPQHLPSPKALQPSHVKSAPSSSKSSGLPVNPPNDSPSSDGHTTEDDLEQDPRPTKIAKKGGKKKRKAKPRPLTEAQSIRLQAKKAKRREGWRRRRAEVNAAQFSHHATRPAVQQKYVSPAIPIQTAMKTENARVASTGYVGLNDYQHRDHRDLPLSALVGEDSEYRFKLITWDGRLSSFPLIILIYLLILYGLQYTYAHHQHGRHSPRFTSWSRRPKRLA